jgi:hypothetical protein
MPVRYKNCTTLTTAVKIGRRRAASACGGVDVEKGAGAEKGKARRAGRIYPPRDCQS